MDFAMMAAAKRHRELIADLPAKCAVLGETQMMRIRGHAAAKQTRLLGHKPDVLAVANPAWLGMGKLALVDTLSAAWPSRFPRALRT
jgi:hypothetical protein